MFQRWVSFGKTMQMSHNLFIYLDFTAFRRASGHVLTQKIEKTYKLAVLSIFGVFFGWNQGKETSRQLL